MRELIKKERKILSLGAIHTLLIDGNFLMKRSYERTLTDGKYHTKKGHIGGAYLFMMSLRKLIRETDCSKCVLCWDGENGGKLRYNIYQEYKANRTSKKWHDRIGLSDAQIQELEQSKRTMLAQRVRVQQYCEELFIRQVELDEMEADDLIAYYCQKYHDQEKISIFTNDRDMCQLLAYQNVSIILANLQKTDAPLLSINKNNYFMYFEHHFANACLVKTVCGDTSDNIRGIIGLKEKGLLNHFPEIKTVVMDYAELLTRAEQLREERKIADKKAKDLKVINALLAGRTLTMKHGQLVEEDLGLGFFILNKQLTDLSQPMLTREAIHELTQISELPLQSEERGSKTLMAYMQDDGFLGIWGSDFTGFVKPFFPVILQEKAFEKACMEAD